MQEPIIQAQVGRRLGDLRASLSVVTLCLLCPMRLQSYHSRSCRFASLKLSFKRLRRFSNNCPARVVRGESQGPRPSKSSRRSTTQRPRGMRGSVVESRRGSTCKLAPPRLRLTALLSHSCLISLRSAFRHVRAGERSPTSETPP